MLFGCESVGRHGSNFAACGILNDMLLPSTALKQVEGLAGLVKLAGGLTSPQLRLVLGATAAVLGCHCSSDWSGIAYSMQWYQPVNNTMSLMTRDSFCLACLQSTDMMGY